MISAEQAFTFLFLNEDSGENSSHFKTVRILAYNLLKYVKEPFNC